MSLESAKTGDDAQHLWTTSRWDGLALGLNQQTQSAMGLALSRIPGIADNQLPAPTTITAQKHWRHIDTASSEHALLLFCPTASRRHRRRSRVAAAGAVVPDTVLPAPAGRVAIGLRGVQRTAPDSRPDRPCCSACNRRTPHQWNCSATFSSFFERPASADRTASMSRASASNARASPINSTTPTCPAKTPPNCSGRPGLQATRRIILSN